MFDVEALAPGLGVRVEAGDVTKLSDAEISELTELWREHHVLLFRGQSLDANDQKDFVAKFGPVGELGNVDKSSPDAERHVMMIANRKYDGIEGSLPDGEMWFHFDQAYLEVPIVGGFLYGIEVPSSGGYTLFSSAASLYEQLPQATKDRLLGLEAENVYDFRATTAVLGDGEEVTSFTHPVVIEHPVTGRPTLFVSKLMTRRILGIPEEESRAILDDIFARIENQEARYEHHWQSGDLVVWDNRSVLHARTDFDPAEARILRRLSVAGQGAPRAFEMAGSTG